MCLNHLNVLNYKIRGLSKDDRSIFIVLPASNFRDPILQSRDSWNYMPPILVSSSVKCTAAQILVIAKLNGKKIILRGLCLWLSSVPARNYLFKVSSWSTRIRCENCSRLKMSKTLERFQWRRSSVFIVSCEHISNFVLIIDLEQANVCCVNIEKINAFEDKIRYIMRSVVVF